MISDVTFTLKRIDWEELKNQKLELIKLTGFNPDSVVTDQTIDAIEGLLNFIDHIQDQAYATGQFKKEDIFNTEIQVI